GLVELFLLPLSYIIMAGCRGKAKCYKTKDKKNCLTPNPWIVFLRTHKDRFHSIGEASKYNKIIFKKISLER
ncbi:unnamed protein product, partial [Ectocarpus sp. 4 AP-2014]